MYLNQIFSPDSYRDQIVNREALREPQGPPREQIITSTSSAQAWIEAG